MDDARQLYLDAALALDQATRGRGSDLGAAGALASRFSCADVRSSRRLAPLHRAALSRVSRPCASGRDMDLSLSSAAGELRDAAAGLRDPALLHRCRDLCLALHEAGLAPASGR